MHLEQILQYKDQFTAPQHLIDQATLRDFNTEYARSIADPDSFWGEWASRFTWTKPWEQVMQWEYPNHQWFVELVPIWIVAKEALTEALSYSDFP